MDGFEIGIFLIILLAFLLIVAIGVGSFVLIVMPRLKAIKKEEEQQKQRFKALEELKLKSVKDHKEVLKNFEQQIAEREAQHKAELERRKNCMECHLRYELGRDVVYEILPGEERRITTYNNRLIKKIQFTCTCPQCHDEKIYTESFDVEITYKSGPKGNRVHRKSKYELEDLIQKYFQS